MGAEKSQHGAGWYAGALVFWLLSAWLITVGLSSIIPQIFWPAGPAPEAAAQGAAGSCAATLRALRRELFDHVGQRFSQPSSADRDAQHAWFESWDRRLFRARPSCRGSEQAAFTELGRLRHGVQALVERFEREEAPRVQRLEQLLGTSEQVRALLPQDESHENDRH